MKKHIFWSFLLEILKGNTVQNYGSLANGVYSPSGAPVKLLSPYNLTNDPLYAKIQGRTLTSLYVGLDAEKNSKAIIWSDNTTLPGTTKDKLWLLSTSEVKTLLGTTPSLLKTCIYSETDSRVATWALRSPDPFAADCATGVDTHGDLYSSSISSVRPAFLF